MRRLAFLLLSALQLHAAEDPTVLVAKLQPATGWTASEPARTATHDTLFDLIDGGAELYQEYGFVRAVSWQFENAARSTIQIELYEMADAPAAYGVWSLMQTGKYQRGTLGQGSLRFGYYVAFWSGPYFASVTGAQPDAATQAEVDRLASELAALLPHEADLTNWPFPNPSFIFETRKYFRGRIGLSNISVPAILDQFETNEGIVVEIWGSTSIHLRFASEAEAQGRFAEGLARVRTNSALSNFTEEPEKCTGVAGDGRRVVIERRGNAVVVFVGDETVPRDGEPIPADKRRY
ncbi:MAG TPA: DUF6599 family protein [Opitutaceae bacterium]|nr:DUF6599 family protein [Opitutaceae bacterium]